MSNTQNIDILRSLTDAIGPFTVICVDGLKRAKLTQLGEHEIGSLLHSFVSEFVKDHDGSTNATSVIKGMILTAQRVSKQGIIPYGPDVVNTVLSSYVNYVAKNYCKVDFSIRAADLDKPVA